MYPESVTAEDIALFELDMARQYEDNSWGLDEINGELQMLASEGV